LRYVIFPHRDCGYGAPQAHLRGTTMTFLTAAKPSLPHPLAALALLLLLPLLSACGFNTIPTNEERAKAAWSEVLNQYQRRTDLIPNLVETVKGYAAHEREVLEAVVQARAQATQVQLPPEALDNPEAFKAFQEGQAGLTGALSRLLAVVENYPDLKASQNFLALQAQLEGTENRIAVARRDYIEAVRVYNTSLRTFPSVLWANFWFTDNEPFQTFSIPEENTQAPKVDFGSGG
jgi:LemA protein